MLHIVLVSLYASKCMVQFVAFVELLPVSSTFIISNTSKFWMHSLFLICIYMCVCVISICCVYTCVHTHVHRKAILIMLEFISSV